MQFKEKFMATPVGKNMRVMDIVRHVESFAGDGSLQLSDPEVVLHSTYGSFAEVREAVVSTTRTQGVLGVTPMSMLLDSRRREVQDRKVMTDEQESRPRTQIAGAAKKPARCWSCGDPNHMSPGCPKPVTCRNSGRAGKHISRRIVGNRNGCLPTSEVEARAEAMAR